MTRVGFIGAGGIVAAHCRKMAKHPASFSVAGFFDVQPERGPCPVLDTEARNTARVIEAIQRSARENREVELEDD